MEKKYRDLYALFQNEPVAWQYFYSLPRGLRDRISNDAATLHTYSGLKSIAETLSRQA